jgi:hypothetical protein
MDYQNVSEKRRNAYYSLPTFEIIHFSIYEVSQIDIPWLKLLSEEETERYYQIQNYHQKSEFLYCRGFLRLMIAQILNLEKQRIKDILIHYSHSGKPKFLIDQKQFLPFSVSHRLGYAAIVIAAHILSKDIFIGIDIEKESPWGKEYITQWSRREAYIKAFEKKPPMPFIPKEFEKEGYKYIFREKNIDDYFLTCLLPKNVNVYSRQSLPILSAFKNMLD